MDTDIASEFRLIHLRFKDFDSRVIDLSSRVQALDEHRIKSCLPDITK